MVASCVANVTYTHTTLSLSFFPQSEEGFTVKTKTMFTNLDRLLPHRADDYLAPGTNGDVSFAFALSILESHGITRGSLVVLDRNELTLQQIMTHVIQENESATLTILCRNTNLCSCASLGVVPLRVQFQLQLADMVTDLKRHRLDRSSPKAPGCKKSSSIRVKCYHCEALKTITISSNRLAAIPLVPSAPIYIGQRALIGAAFCGDISRYNCSFDGGTRPIYLLPITEMKLQTDPSREAVDLTDAVNQPPDVGSLSVWHMLRNSVGPGGKHWLRDVTSTGLVTRYGPAGPWAVRMETHLDVHSVVRVHRDGSCLVVSSPGQQRHLRLQCDGIALTPTCIEDLAEWHQTNSASFKFKLYHATPDPTPPVPVKMEEEDADQPPSPVVTSTSQVILL
jgi:hypothetical protein